MSRTIRALKDLIFMCLFYFATLLYLLLNQMDMSVFIPALSVNWL